MGEHVALAVDACGGDNAPDAVLEGVRSALSEDCDLEILLCGLPEIVEPFAQTLDRCTAVSATQVIAMDEHPADAVKSKKDSSIVVGTKLVSEGRAKGFFSAGSTGACLVAATLNIGRMKAVKRPALAVVLPSYKKPTLLLDIGANADCKPEYLVQFGIMGKAYMSSVLGVKDPSVALLNIGEEDSKGSLFAQQAHRLMSESIPAFVGNCEGGDLLDGEYDVIVTDGFTGNVCLKTIEGTSKVLFKMVKDALTSSPRAKMGAALASGALSDLKRNVSPDTFGSSPLLGLKGICMVGHGSSGALAVKNGIDAGCREIRTDVVGNIANLIKG